MEEKSNKATEEMLNNTKGSLDDEIFNIEVLIGLAMKIKEDTKEDRLYKIKELKKLKGELIEIIAKEAKEVKKSINKRFKGIIKKIKAQNENK